MSAKPFCNHIPALLPNGKTVPVKLAHAAMAEFQFLEPDLLGIALVSRISPVSNRLNKKTVSTVARNAEAFRRVAKECPKLLPLMLTFYRKCPFDDPDRARDPVLGLKMRMLYGGLTQATWRYVVRYGSRLFAVPWSLSREFGSFDAAVSYLHLLQAAKLPPPPPASVVRSLICVYGHHTGKFVFSENDVSQRINPLVLRASFIEANHRNNAGSLSGFVDEFLGVCWWAENSAQLDRNQSKAGWGWLVRQWQRAESTRRLSAAVGSNTWTNRVSRFEHEGIEVVPIESTEALVDEALALRNCLTRHAGDCAHGIVEIYSCRQVPSGKRLGCIGVRFPDHLPELFDVKGYANLPPGNAITLITDGLLSRFPP